jgi:hypothetical protein
MKEFLLYKWVPLERNGSSPLAAPTFLKPSAFFTTKRNHGCRPPCPLLPPLDGGRPFRRDRPHPHIEADIEYTRIFIVLPGGRAMI